MCMKTLSCNYKMLNPNIVSCDGCYVIDESGKRYVDFEAGVWCLSLGHNNKQVNDAIIKQLSSTTLRNGLYAIGNDAFRNNNLTGPLVIPSTVRSIGHRAFDITQREFDGTP